MSAPAERCPITLELTNYLASVPGRDLPEAVMDKTKLHILDTAAAIISGSQLEAGRQAVKFAGSLGGHREATVIASDIVTSAYHAAFANAMAAHADETDDSHLLGRFHPGCGIVPTALAMAERNHGDGAQFLKAVAAGYDIGARFSMALGFTGPRSGTHSTHCLAANFGATAAAGVISGFDAERWAYLISYAVQQASGLPYWQRDKDHVEKSFDFGAMGARNAVYAALMVKSGFTGVLDVLTGQHSYLSAFAENETPGAFVEGLGTHYEIMDASIKKWSVGSPIQSALDAMVAMIQENDLKPDDVIAITAHMPDDRLVIIDNRDMPDVCLQYALAASLIDGSMSFAAAHDHARMSAPDIMAVRDRITIVPSPELTRAKPERQSIIELQLKDGRKLTHHAKAVRGTPDNPMTAQEVEAKAHDLIAPILGDEKSGKLIETIRALERVGDMNDLRPLLQP